MKKFTATLLVAAGLLSTLALPVFASAQTETVAQVNAQNEITSLEASLQTLESENASATNNYESIQANIASIQAEITQDQYLNSQSGNNPEIQNELNTAQSEVSGLAVKAANLYNTLRLQVTLGIDQIKLQALELEATL